jgi:hypothetical protein
VRSAAEGVRRRIGFSGSTPAYRGVLELHGLSDLGARLYTLSREGKWGEMATLVSDDTLDLFCARAPYEGLAEAVARRFGGLTDMVTVEFQPDDPLETRRRVVEEIQAIPQTFRGFNAGSSRGDAARIRSAPS